MGISWARLKKINDGSQNEDPQEEIVWNSNLNIAWAKEEETKLREEILKGKMDSKGEKIRMNLLVFGQSGHGKSTLCNGFRTALLGEGHVSHYFQGGATETGKTFTRGLQSSWHGDNLRIMDMSGLNETEQLTYDKITNLLSGKVDFDEQLEFSDEEAKEPEACTNNISCLVIVVRPDKELASHVKRLMDAANSLVKRGDTCRHAVISFLDKIDPMFKEPEKLKQFLTSSEVKKAVKDVSDDTGIPLSAISVVSTYWNQSKPDLHTNILLLSVLDDILFDAKEHHERRIANRAI